MTDLLPQFGSFAFTLVAFVVALSVIVAIHELGHLLVGRWTGIRAEVFSVGFGPVLLSRTDRHGTRWQLAALPFGGFVKFWGDANAASVGGNVRALTPEERRHTMLGAPLWARALTVAAGPAANFILAVLVFAAVIAAEGRPTDPLTVASVAPLPESYAQGLEVGDEVLSIGGVPVSAEDLRRVGEAEIPLGPTVAYEVLRRGERITVEGPWPFPPIAGAVSPDSAARDAGLRAGDVITAVDGRPVFAFEQVVDAVSGSDGRPLTLAVWRDGETLTLEVAPRRTDLPRGEGGFETRWLLGVTAGPLFEVETVTLGPLAALGDAVRQLWFVITSSLSGLGHMITGAISTCNLSGPVGIAEVSGDVAADGPRDFLWFVAALSTAVGLMNLFPIPVLDGGHLVFHAYEAVAGRPPGDAALRVLMAVGLALILTLTVFGVANDLFLCP